MRNHMTNGDLIRIRKMIREGHTTSDTIQVVVRIPLHRIQQILDMESTEAEAPVKKAPVKKAPVKKAPTAAAKAVAEAKAGKVDPLS